MTKNLNLKNRNLIIFSAVISILESPGSILGLGGICSLRHTNYAPSDCIVCTASESNVRSLCRNNSRFPMKMWASFLYICCRIYNISHITWETIQYLGCLPILASANEQWLPFHTKSLG